MRILGDQAGSANPIEVDSLRFAQQVYCQLELLDVHHGNRVLYRFYFAQAHVAEDFRHGVAGMDLLILHLSLLAFKRKLIGQQTNHLFETAVAQVFG